MSIRSVVTRGYGQGGAIRLVVVRGYGVETSLPTGGFRLLFESDLAERKREKERLRQLKLKREQEALELQNRLDEEAAQRQAEQDAIDARKAESNRLGRMAKNETLFMMPLILPPDRKDDAD